MYLSTVLAKKIINSCELEDRGVHQVQGWTHYMSAFMLDNVKITFDHKSKNPRNREQLLVEALKKSAQGITVILDVTWSGFVSGPRINDSTGVLALIKKYCVNQYEDFPYKNTSEKSA